MRLWSISPEYLDTKGLLAVWREGLLAKKVLESKTIGYRNHPQLIRFKNYENPIILINSYLTYVFLEAEKRGYNFLSKKIEFVYLEKVVNVTKGQIEYEFRHLQNKLIIRDYKKYLENINVSILKTNPIFNIVDGDIEYWEKVKHPIY